MSKIGDTSMDGNLKFKYCLNYFLKVITKAPIRYIPFFIKNWKLLFTEPHLVDIVIKWYKIQDRVCGGIAFKNIEAEVFDCYKRSYALKFIFPVIMDNKGNHVYLTIIYVNYYNGDAEFIVNMTYPANSLRNKNKKYYLDIKDGYIPTNEDLVKGLFKDVEYYYLQSLR